jgi:hypothetical protein
MVCLVALAPSVRAGEPVAEENPVPGTSFAVVRYKLEKGDAVQWDVSPEPTKVKEYTDGDIAYLHFNGPEGKYRVNAFVINFDTKKFERKKLDVVIGKAPQPPPVPPGPVPPIPPVPPDPKPPGPVTSFRVFLVFESADNLSASQRGVVYGKVVEDWLTANCTGGKNGWRRRDKDAPGEADATMAKLWDAVKPAITVTPCVAVERNGKVEIINVEANPAKMVEVLSTYKGK